MPFTESDHMARARAAGYKTWLEFTRLHTDRYPTMAGLTTSYAMPFCDEKRALDWVEAINRPKIAKRNGYTVTAYALSAL